MQTPVVVLDDAEVNHQRETEERNKQGKEIVETEGQEEVDENTEALKEAPFWFPDGWIINVHHDDGGSTLRVRPCSACMLNFIHVLPTSTLIYMLVCCLYYCCYVDVELRCVTYDLSYANRRGLPYQILFELKNQECTG